MARIRSIKPEVRTSLVVASWPRDVRYFWVLLWGYLDDHGRGVDEPRLVKADCLPLDDDVTAEVINEWLDVIALSPSRPLCRYVIDNKRYMHCLNWTEHQRPSHPTPSRIPQCPIHKGSPAEIPSGELPEEFANDSGDKTEPLVPEQGAGSREQVVVEEELLLIASDKPATAPKRGKVKPPKPGTDHDPDFVAFWAEYPRKIAKGQARDAWAKAIRAKVDPQLIIEGARRYTADPTRNPEFTAYPSTWLNGERWHDSPALDARRGHGSVPAPLQGRCDTCQGTHFLEDDAGRPTRRCPDCNPERASA